MTINHVVFSEWNNFVIQYGPRSGAFLQSYEWGEFQKAAGRRVLRVTSDDLTAVTQLIEHPIRSGFFGFDLPRGPDRFSECLSSALREAKKTAALFVHVEPVSTPSPIGSGVPIGSLPVEKWPATNRQPQHTILLDLSKPEDELLKAMHEKTRYNIRLAERKGVVVAVEADSDVFWRLLSETTARDEFSPHTKPYYETMLRTLASGDCQAKLWVARFESRPLAAAIVVTFGHTATYLHGASSDEHRNLMAPHLLHWRVIQDVKRRGLHWYDFWGVDEKRWPGVTRFKLGFGGTRESYPAAYDLPLRKFWYRMYRIGRKIMKHRTRNM